MDLEACCLFLPSETSDASSAVAFVVALVASLADVGEAALKKRKVGFFGSPHPPSPFPVFLTGGNLQCWPVFAKEESLLFLSLTLMYFSFLMILLQEEMQEGRGH